MVHSGRVASMVLWVGIACSCPFRAYPFGGEHHRISAVAIDSLPPEERDYLSMERAAIVGTYCGFPDLNWACYGQWGGGTGDPALPRMPDTRRLWGVSFYCQWDPVRQEGKAYPHSPPRSWEASGAHLLRAVESLRKGRLEDGCRILGVMLHYIQDSGSFPHVQPIHRNFHVKNMESIQLNEYSPRRLGHTPREAADALSRRVEELTGWTEQRLAPLLAAAGMPLQDAKQWTSRQTMAAAVVAAVDKLRAEKPSEFEAVATECANECARVCADAIHTALAFAQKPYVEPSPAALNVNLVFNPSFEDGDGDDAPAGWCVGWLDPHDRAGRAEWYRAGTHWEKHVRTGNRSALLLWPPEQGLEWQLAWPHAVRARAGEKYRASAWGKSTAATSGGHLALEFSGADYKPVRVLRTPAVKPGVEWRQLSVDATVPPSARWLRVILHGCGGAGAVWYDDVEVVRLP